MRCLQETDTNLVLGEHQQRDYATLPRDGQPEMAKCIRLPDISNSCRNESSGPYHTEDTTHDLLGLRAGDIPPLTKEGTDALRARKAKVRSLEVHKRISKFESREG